MIGVNTYRFLLRINSGPRHFTPDPQPWGTFSFLKDSEGNSLLLVERPDG